MTNTGLGGKRGASNYLRLRVEGKTLHLKGWSESTLAGTTVIVGTRVNRYGVRSDHAVQHLHFIDVRAITKRTIMRQADCMGDPLEETRP